MAENIEIKARCSERAAVQKKVREIASEYRGTDFQQDTYYRVTNGRLKLRESKLDGNYLIPYMRADQTGPRKSFYATIKIHNVDEVKHLLKNMLGIHAVISKKRDIYFYDNVRIHLDTVDRLGEFIELEAVMEPPFLEPKVERKKIKYLMDILQIKEEDLIAESYEALISLIDAKNT